MSSERALATAADAAAKSVPGVTALYPAGGLRGRFGAVKDRLLGGPEGPASQIDRPRGRVRCRVDISISTTATAVTVCQSVRDEVASALEALGAAEAQVVVTVVRVSL